MGRPFFKDQNSNTKIQNTNSRNQIPKYKYQNTKIQIKRRHSVGSPYPLQFGFDTRNLITNRLMPVCSCANTQAAGN
ncbi:hypothetical protein KAR48_15765, partial [bacterium]|nr:hypothetical protein [bacterium]